MRQAIEWQVDKEEYSDDWLILHREVGADCPRCSGTVERYSIGGRNGYYCPECQIIGKK